MSAGKIGRDCAESRLHDFHHGQLGAAVVVGAKERTDPRQEWRRHGLALLASSAAGVSVQVQACGAGQPAWTDRVSVHADLALPEARLREAVVAHGLLIAAGSLRRALMRGLIGRPALARRYFALELGRALALFGDALPLAVERSLRAVTEPCENRSDGKQSMALALDPQQVVRELPAHLGRLRPSRLAWSKAGPRTGAKSAVDDGMRPIAVERHDGDDDEIDQKSNRWLKWFSAPLGGGPVSNLFVNLLGFGRAAGADGGSDAEGDGGTATGLADDSAGASSAASEVEGAAKVPMHSGARPAPSSTRFIYPEWKQAAGRYLEGHVQVHEVAPWVDQAKRQSRAPIPQRALRAQLARVGAALQRHRAQPDGDALDLDRVIRYGVERRHGAGPDRLHVASRRTRRDLSMLVMLDASGSTVDALPSGGTIFDQQRELAREVVRACQKLDDRVALYGFHSWGRHNVRCLGIKGFSQPADGAMDRRLDAVRPEGLTRLGAAIRHGTHLLAQDEAHSHRVMLLLSDGFAYDDEYRDEHAQGDTQRALQEAAAAGIACVCLNVGSQQDDETLKRIYGGAAYLRCADARHAVPALGRLILNAIGQARAMGRDRRRNRSGRRRQAGHPPSTMA